MIYRVLTPHPIYIYYYALIHTYPLFALADGALLYIAYVLLWTLLTYITYPLETLHLLQTGMGSNNWSLKENYSGLSHSSTTMTMKSPFVVLLSNNKDGP
jgi:hypothetical protein